MIIFSTAGTTKGYRLKQHLTSARRAKEHGGNIGGRMCPMSRLDLAKQCVALSWPARGIDEAKRDACNHEPSSPSCSTDDPSTQPAPALNSPMACAEYMPDANRLGRSQHSPDT